MATIINEVKKICDIDYNGPIAELHFIYGPVKNARLNADQILQLIGNGKKVYEHLNDGSVKLLTIANYADVSETPVKTQEVEEKEEVKVQNILSKGPVQSTYLSKQERKKQERLKREQEALEKKKAEEAAAAERLKAALEAEEVKESPAEVITEDLKTEVIEETPVTEEALTKADA